MDITELKKAQSEPAGPSELAWNLDDKEINDPSIGPREEGRTAALDVVDEPEVNIVDVEAVCEERNGDGILLGFEVKQCRETSPAEEHGVEQRVQKVRTASGEAS